MKKLIVVYIAILALSGCSPGYYDPPSYVDVVIIDAPDIPDCGGDWVETPHVVQAPPPRNQPISKTPSYDTRTKTPRSTPTRGEGPPRTKGGRSR